MRSTARLAVLVVAMLAVVSGLSSSDRVMTADSLQTPHTPGELVISGKDGKPAGACPLKHTDVDAQVSGFIARVTVVQEFANPTQEKIEAVYAFPLPEDSAVDRMEMKVGERTIVGEIRRREEAREIYVAAKEAGHVASLLDQERPNIFTQSVANIEPGAEVKITISYTQLLKYEAGTYEFAFPMVVGPRFIPGSEVGHQGNDAAPEATEVADARKLTPPITPKGTRAGHDISVRVQVNAGIPVTKAECITHDADYTWPDGGNSVTVTLKDKVTIPNKDFVLRYDVAGESVQSGLITSAPGGEGGYFALVMQPPKTPKPKFVTPKEMVFVIDTSGSQMGEPLKKSKETMLHCIKNVNSGDTFQMIQFSSSVKKLFDKPRPYTRENLDAALKFLTECEAGGGTQMMPAIKEALAGPFDKERLRMVVFFTDGYIGNDFQIVDHIQKNSQHARVFSFGIGNGVNRFLIEKMAEAGRGASEIVLLDSKSEQVAERFYNRIRNPLLTDISVDWGGLPIAAEKVYPRRAPDLFSAQPLILKGYYSAAASGEITVRGRVNGEAWSRTLKVSLPEHQSDNDALASIWARSKVEDIMSKDWMGAQNGKPDPTVKDEIVEIALSYNLMTQYTSFVAVERMVVTTGGTPRTINVPVEMPEGVSYEGVRGDSDGDRFGLSLGRGYGGYGGAPAAGATHFYAARGVAPPKGAAMSVLDSSIVTGTPGASKAKPATTAPPATPVDSKLALGDKPVSLGYSYSDGASRTAGEVFDSTEVNGSVEVAERFSLATKLDKTLLDLCEKYKKSGESGSYSIPGRLVVKDGKVEVMIRLKDGNKERLAEFEKLGLADHMWLVQDKILIGWIPLAKLEEIAKLELVSRISAPDYGK